MKRICLFLALFVTAGAVAPAATAQLRKAERALEAQNFEEAHSIVQARLKDKPNDHNAFDLLARIHEAEAMASEGEAFLEHWKEMVAAYRQLLEVRPRSEAEVTTKLLIAYQNSFMGGVELFNGAREALDAEAGAELFMKASLQFRAASLVMPDSLDPYLNWAYAAMSGGVDIEAIEPLKRALEIGPAEMEWYNYLGRIYLSNERTDDAVMALEEGVEMFPGDEELQGLLLNAYASTGQNDRAIERYQERVQAMPDDRISRYNLGSLLLQAERYNEAIEQLEVAIAIDDQHVDSHYNLGAAFINKATDIQRQAAALDDSLRAERDSLSQEEIDARQEAYFALDEEKKRLMALAIPYLERAKVLSEKLISEGVEVDISGICRALFQAYGQTNAMEKLETVKVCSGF